MIREVKFRGKSVDGQLVYGIPIKTHIGIYMVIEENPHVCSVYGYMEIDEFVKVDENTIGQFTGLYDKNGKEIYEGDIVHLDAWSPYAMQIVFLEGAFCLADEDGHYLGDIHYIHHAEVEQCTVIGNIYDNSELLKEN